MKQIGENVALKGVKKFGSSASVVMELSSDTNADYISWYIVGDWIANKPITTKIQYDFSQIDSTLEPRPYFKTHTSIIYLDEIELK
jgi:hypothetical protein